MGRGGFYLLVESGSDLESESSQWGGCKEISSNRLTPAILTEKKCPQVRRMGETGNVSRIRAMRYLVVIWRSSIEGKREGFLWIRHGDTAVWLPPLQYHLKLSCALSITIATSEL